MQLRPDQALRAIRRTCHLVAQEGSFESQRPADQDAVGLEKRVPQRYDWPMHFSDVDASTEGGQKVPVVSLTSLCERARFRSRGDLY